MAISVRIGTRILLALLVALGLMLLIGGVGFLTARNLTGHLQEFTDNRLPSVNALWAVQQAVTDAARNVNALVLTGMEEGARKRASNGFRDAQQRIDDASYVYASLLHSSDALALWQDAAAKLETWRALARKLATIAVNEGGVGFAEQGSKKAALLEETRAADDAVEEALSALIARTAQEAVVGTEAGHEAARRGALEVIAALLVGGVLMAGFGLALIRAIHRTVARLGSEASRLRDGVAAGQVSVRGEVAALAPEFRPVVAGMNQIMDAFEQPLRMTVEYVTRIGKGDIPERIAGEYQGDFQLIQASLNDCIDAVNALVADTRMLAQAGVEGRLSTRADATRHQGDFRKVVQGVNDSLDAVTGPLGVAARYMDQISRGRIPARITERYAGDFDALKESLNRCIEAVNRLVADAGMLAGAGREGRLSARADVSRHEGDFRAVVEGVNQTLDAVTGPLEATARYLDRISRGEIPEGITETFAGDYGAIKKSLETCIAAVNLLVSDAGRLVEAAVVGQLTIRADAGRHQGDFRKIVEGVNETLDAVLAPVQEAGEVLEQLARRDLRARMVGSYQGDHARIKESVNATGEALHGRARTGGVGGEPGVVRRHPDRLLDPGGGHRRLRAGLLAGGDHAVARVGALHDPAGRRERPAGQRPGPERPDRRHRGRHRGGADAGRHGQDPGVGREHLADHPGHQRHRLPDQPAGAERRGRGGPGRRGRARLRGGGGGGPLAGPARQGGGQQDRGAHPPVGQAGRRGRGDRAAGGGQARRRSSDGVGKVTDIVSEIAAAAREQTSGIDQVNQAVAEMDKVTQQNAASAEESSSAASELSGQAEELAAMVGSFRLVDAAATPHGVPRLAPGGGPRRIRAAGP